MMAEDMRLSRDELPAFAALVAAAWERTARNPSDEECAAMVAVAREMALTGAVLQ